MSENDHSSEETSSESEDEILQMESHTQDETTEAIDAFLDENERLEEQEQEFLQLRREGKGKQNAPKNPQPDLNTAMWKEIRRLQGELESLKRPREDAPSATSSAKRKKTEIDVSGDTGAFDRPSSSRHTEVEIKPKGSRKQLSSAKSSQLSSASNVTQLRSANLSQLSSATGSTQNENQEDAVQLHEVEDNDDPLRVETDEIQRNADPQEPEEEDEVSSDEDEIDVPDETNIFANLVEGVNIEGDSERPGPAITQVWADKINLAWKTKIGKLTHTALLQKYKTASNLTALAVPQVNKEIWKPLNKWQKKADLNMTSCQRSLIGVVSAVLKLHDNVRTLDRETRQTAMQTAADIVSLLGKVNRELMARRKISA